MVWVHTLRAMRLLELRQSGRQMWAELGRGFPYAAISAVRTGRLTGVWFDVEGAGRYPDGLTPQPQ